MYHRRPRLVREYWRHQWDAISVHGAAARGRGGGHYDIGDVTAADWGSCAVAVC